MADLGFHAALRIARLRRIIFRIFSARFTTFPRKEFPEVQIPLHFVAFSGHNDLPEQQASILSFVRNVGVPEKLTIVSDGTHTPADRAWFSKVFPHSQVMPFGEFITVNIPPTLLRYAAVHPLGKKLAIISQLKIDGPTLYSDSDILYFPGARELCLWASDPTPAVSYLLDCWPSLDERLLNGDDEKAFPVNSGFLQLGCVLDWSLAFSRVSQMTGDPSYFTEQTAIHLAVRKSGGQPLSIAKYIMQNDDQWDPWDRYASRSIVLRHYISSFRHKMWHHVPLAVRG